MLLLAYEQWAREWAQKSAGSAAAAVFFLIAAAACLAFWFWRWRQSRNAVDADIIEPAAPPVWRPSYSATPSSMASSLQGLILAAGILALLFSTMAGGCTALAVRNYNNAKANAAWSAKIVEECRTVVDQSRGPWSDRGPLLRGKLFVWDLASEKPTPTGHTKRPSWLMLGFSTIPSEVRATRDDQELTACFIVDADFIAAGHYQLPGSDEQEQAYDADIHLVAVYWPSLKPAGRFKVRSESYDEIREGRDTSGRFHFQMGQRILAKMTR